MTKTKRYDQGIAVAACVVELNAEAPTEIKLLPAGEFRARDGRPQGLKAWRLDDPAAARVIAKAAGLVGDLVLDYEHQTLNAEVNGQPAPAAAWFKELAWRPGDGLYAVDVRWTAKARALIEAGEYRYISPVFDYDKKTGVVQAVLMAALTNYPALDGHSDLAARAAAKFQQPETEEDHVDRTKLITMLGLDAEAGDEQIDAALAALKTKAAEAETKDGQIAALKAAGDKPDPAKFVPVATFEALKGEVAALKGRQTAGEVAGLVAQGITDGKLLPVQEAWATELGNKDVAALKSYLEKTPAIAALGGTQTAGRKPAEGAADEEGLSEDELAVCRGLGVSAEEYKKAK